MIRPVLLLLPLALVACDGDGAQNRTLDTLDEELGEAATGNAGDPAIAAALQDQIMVDPQLAAQANGDAVRPPGRPYSAAVPDDNVAPSPPSADTAGLKATPAAGDSCPQCTIAEQSVTLGALAAAQKNKGLSGCAARMGYAAGWANRLPLDVPLHPDARVLEAAGVDQGGCGLRAVSFATPASLGTTLDWYYTKLTAKGFSAEHESDGAQHVLGGTRGRAAYVLFLSERADGGTDVDLVANGGR
jgi:hypothetical protein